MKHRVSSSMLILTTAIALRAALPTQAGAQATGRWSPSIGVTVNAALGRPETNWGLGATAALLRRSGRFAFGVEAGYQALGTEVTRVDDFDNQPGSVYREEFTRSMLRLAALVRADVGSGPVRPYLVAGAGAYDGRFHDRIEVRDANGQRIPFYDFEGSGGDVKPGLTAGLGLDLKRRRGGPGLALEARWHGILDLTEDGFGTADFLSLGLALTW
jgi:hypothetical protein